MASQPLGLPIGLPQYQSIILLLSVHISVNAFVPVCQGSDSTTRLSSALGEKSGQLSSSLNRSFAGAHFPYRAWTPYATPCGEIDLRPLNLGAVREIVVSSRTQPFASIWSHLQAIQEMSGVETPVIGNRVPLHDLPAVLVVKDLLPNLSANTSVTPSLDEIASFVPVLRRHS